MLKDSGEEAVEEFKKEAMIMAQVPYHENVVSLVGIVTKGELHAKLLLY